MDDQRVFPKVHSSRLKNGEKKQEPGDCKNIGPQRSGVGTTESLKIMSLRGADKELNA